MLVHGHVETLALQAGQYVVYHDADATLQVFILQGHDIPPAMTKMEVAPFAGGTDGLLDNWFSGSQVYLEPGATTIIRQVKDDQGSQEIPEILRNSA
jgi:hypothetical protein